ncbi:MAG: hypothetical protein COB17_07165 [Sulfurimonas sp.]|nr:MAG: hypothetical protein COB17_07165 [Sulfurimonas sp.]
MTIYNSDNKQLLDVEYDTIPIINDLIDGMIVLSTDRKAADEYAVFLLESSSKISCYIFDEVFIVGRVTGFEPLPEAIEAWNKNERDCKINCVNPPLIH